MTQELVDLQHPDCSRSVISVFSLFFCFFFLLLLFFVVVFLSFFLFQNQGPRHEHPRTRRRYWFIEKLYVIMYVCACVCVFVFILFFIMFSSHDEPYTHNIYILYMSVFYDHRNC